MGMKKKKLLVYGLLAAVLVALILLIAWGNTALELNRYTITSSRLPEGFDGYRIAQVSDLHNAQMGKDNETLLAMLREAEPDMIAVTGDLIDSRYTDTDVALQFIREAVKIAPCYYVTGNHEARIDIFEEWKSSLAAAGAVILDDLATEIRIGEEAITLIGVNDPSFWTDYLFGDAESVMASKLEALHEDAEGFTILLSHRPELFTVYKNYGMELVLSGHAHGGQFRLPFLGGIVAPNQGLFPEYDGGLYSEGGTNMLVSRGIGNSAFPFRINNRPEVLLIELRVSE